MDAHRVAAIDIGTVTTRLLVVDVGPDTIVEVARSTDITHLGEGLRETGRLSPEAIARVERVIAGYAADMARLGVEVHRGVATSASRDAANGAEFTAMLAAHGIDVAVVPGEEEARLAFAGATWGLAAEGLLVNDIGGGSTELVFGDAPGSIRHAESVDVGSRRVTDAFLASDPPAPQELDAARAWISQQFEPYFAALPARPHASIALAGTATTLAAIREELAEYDSTRVHGSVLTREEIETITGRLAAMPLAERLEVAGLHPGRAGVIVAGALILGIVLDAAGLDSTIVSEHDILYGIALDVFSGLA